MPFKDPVRVTVRRCMLKQFINLYIMASVTLLLLVACDVGKAEHDAVEPNEETSIDRISPIL